MKPEAMPYKYLNMTTTLSIILAYRIFTNLNQVANNNDEDPIVRISSGLVRGVSNQKSRDGALYYKFIGLSYGVVDKRFGRSRPVEPWMNIFTATQPGHVCYQKTFGSQQIVGEEDCLNLNVFTRTLACNSNINRTSLKPVMVFIHGGGFVAGNSAMYGPDYLMDEDIVLVTLNYRLGPFGWLNLGIKDAAGNQGAKDIILGLQWIQSNIQVFNGNPGLVTLFGESAGSRIVTALLHSPLGRGLFHRVIGQSGVSFTSFAINPRPKYYGERLALKVGCLFKKGENHETNEKLNASQIVACLQNTLRLKILNGLNTLGRSWYNEEEEAELQFNLSFDEGFEEGQEAFLPVTPEELLKSGNYSSVPILIGVNAYDSLPRAARILSNPKQLASMNNEWSRVSPILFAYYNHPNRDNISAAIKQFYFGSDFVFSNSLETNNILTTAVWDRIYASTTRAYGNLLASVNGSVYLYMFDKKMAQKSVYESPIHAEELNYLFKIPSNGGQGVLDGVEPPLDVNTTDYAFSKQLVKLWVSFATTGRPSYNWGNHNGSEPKQPWNRMDPSADEISWVHIDNRSCQSMRESELFKSRMEFWGNTLGVN